ncbi:MAG TPA: DNA adenine methylase [Candidatus Doudnabacteria bacterium]|nr:DNA adenine methylase [Candidatus Doudnabacteria bacterium]
MEFYSPLRYPGGKNKISPFLKDVVLKNKLKNGVYIEPYAGGASIALTLLIEGYVSEIIINDYDKSVYAFWHSIINKTDGFCNKIRNTKVNINVWKKQKRIQSNKERARLFDLGFSTFFLNRTNRSGILKAGPIGGMTQDSEWSIGDRFNKKRLINQIELIAKYKKQIKIYNWDSVRLVNEISGKLPTKTLIYFDPPYYIKGKDLYINYYKHNDHVLVANMISNIKGSKWIVSYDKVPEILNLYRQYSKRKYNLNYSLINGTVGKEVMFFSKNLKFIPSKIV